MKEVVFLYDQVIEHLVRLHQFCRAPMTDLEAMDEVADDVDTVALLLARKDLLAFAVSLRNFAEATQSVPAMKASVMVLSNWLDTSPYFVPTQNTVTLYQVLSRLIHAHRTIICRTSRDALRERTTDVEKILATLHVEDVAVEANLAIFTEREKLTVVSLPALLERACDYLQKLTDEIQKTGGAFFHRAYRI